MQWWQSLLVEISAIVGVVLVLVTIPWILAIKKEATSATAWCLLVFFVPYVGFLLFVLFGYQHVHRHIRRKQRHRQLFRRMLPETWKQLRTAPDEEAREDATAKKMVRLARRFDAFPLSHDNRVKFYFCGEPAFEDILETIKAARHHIHVQSFIVQPDTFGKSFLELLTRKAREGVQVRLLYDAMGSYRLHRWMLRPLREAGGKAAAFLPLDVLRRRLQINLRNHRKILVVDGRVAYTGGMNIGNEYLGKSPRFGFWRDTHFRLEGPAVTGLQYIFLEDWDFAADEPLDQAEYFPPLAAAGDEPVQVVYSGPDQELKSIREVYFAAIQSARRRLWIASPYFVPDQGLRDALALAGYLGVDVRLLGQYHPDKWVPFFAARYYWADMLEAGVKLYQYTKGMMHSKIVLVDDDWASVGTANLDNRSLHLNFEANCLFYSPGTVKLLENAFLDDLSVSIRLKKKVFEQRPFPSRLVENGCRLLSPIL